jgi:2-oxoglutarate ferredoxin oxidoreductase subunit alpha
MFGEDFQMNECAHLHIPVKQMLKDNDASIVQMNTIMLGATMAVMNWPLKLILNNIEKTFGKKGKEIVELNSIMAKGGHDHVVTDYKDKILYTVPPRAPSDKPLDEQLVLTGNDAFALGATVADCRLYVAYPMTPSSTVLSTLAEWAKTTGMVVRHAEDEISVVNTAIGGSFAGARAACGTSGGGFALMAEALSYAGVTETPLVVFLGQRPGPATGLPTWTAQGDLLFALFAGHGEFPKIVLAPGDIEEMYQLSAEAFNLADIYQTPVIVMSDKHLGESHWSISKKDFNTFAQEYVVDRGKITTSVPQDEPYLRYKVTDDGISPMLIPGQKGVFFQANSYEHVEDGHTTEDGQETIAQTDKRNRKLETYLMGHYKGPNIYGDTRMATHIFVTWGSIKGTILDAMKKLEEEGTMCALVHFTHMWPLDKYKVTDILTSKSPKQKWILVENNSHAQFASVIRMTTGIDFKHKLLKYDGRQIFVEDIIDFVQALTGLKEQK